MRRLVLALVVLAGCKTDPKIQMISPKTLCANVESKLVLMGSELEPTRVEIGGGDMGAAMLSTTVEGTGAMITATFAANTLRPSDTPYDVTIINTDGQRFTLPNAVTVVPGITLAAIDPGAVWNGVDFPTSIFGIGMSGVVSATIVDSGGTETALTGVTAVDANRADAVVPMGLAAGTYTVKVVDADGCTAELAGALTIVADITVSVCAIDPPFGWTGQDTDVTITSTSDGKPTSGLCGGKMTKFVSSPRAWLAVAGQLKALRNVSFISDGTLTATVPSGLPASATPYDLIVQNPDGQVGLLSMAFKIVDMPVPEVTGMTPQVVRQNSTNAMKIFGRNFRAPIKVEIYNKAGTFTTIPGVTVTSATQLDFSLDVGALALAIESYVVRVTNMDQGTYGEFSALAVISSSGNITSWSDVAATALPQATMRHGATDGKVSLAARYMYVVGGDSGGGTPTLYDTTQMASLNKFGEIGSWMMTRYKLAAARTWLQLVSVPAASGAGGHLYAVGGQTAAGAVTTVSRTHILLPSEAPVISDSKVTLEGMLARGTWYYRVSAVMNTSDVANPNGETLPSEEFAAHTVENSKVILTWGAITNAAKYRVYRTAMVNGISQTEVLLKDDVAETTFTDDGTVTPGSGLPLVQGEHGAWVDVTTLNDARRALGAALAHDSTGAAFLYALGGDKGSGFANTVAGADIYNTYEYAPLTADGLMLGAWTRGAATFEARTRLQSPVGENATSSLVTPATRAYVYVVGGYNGTALVNNYQAAQVNDGGALAAFIASSNQTSSNGLYQGGASLIAANQLFIVGGLQLNGTPTNAGLSADYGGANGIPPLFDNYDADPNIRQDTSGALFPAALGSLVFSTAHIYLLGGTIDGTTALRRVWSVVY